MTEPHRISDHRPDLEAPGVVARFWRNRRFARVRHGLARLRRSSGWVTRAHARLVVLSGGRIRRSFLFTGGMPILVLTTTGRRTGEPRSTPVGYLRHRGGYAVLASNAGSDRTPDWWRNLQADPRARVLVGRSTVPVVARAADAEEAGALWSTFARLNAGFDEYRRLTVRAIPVVVLEPAPRHPQPGPGGAGGPGHADGTRTTRPSSPPRSTSS